MGRKITPPIPVNAKHIPDKRPTWILNHRLINTGVAKPKSPVVAMPVKKPATQNIHGAVEKPIETRHIASKIRHADKTSRISNFSIHRPMIDEIRNEEINVNEE